MFACLWVSVRFLLRLSRGISCLTFFLIQGERTFEEGLYLYANRHLLHMRGIQSNLVMIWRNVSNLSPCASHTRWIAISWAGGWSIEKSVWGLETCIPVCLLHVYLRALGVRSADAPCDGFRCVCILASAIRHADLEGRGRSYWRGRWMWLWETNAELMRAVFVCNTCRNLTVLDNLPIESRCCALQRGSLVVLIYWLFKFSRVYTLPI